MITIASKDAGGAEILSSWVKKNPGKYKYYLREPALKIFKSKIKINKTSNIKECLDFSDSIISSTGTTDFEIKAIQRFKKKKKKTTVYLDHWFNYKKRFLIKNKIIKVDEIWVNDNIAFKKAKNLFVNSIIKKKKNYFLIDLLKKVKNSNEKKDSILYLTDKKKFKNKKIEILLLKNFLEKIYFKKFFMKKFKLIIRVHPNDNKSKYEKITGDHKLIKISNNTLASDISKSSYVFGNNSMVLYLARKAGVKNSYNFIINNNYKYQCLMKKFKIKECHVRI